MCLATFVPTAGRSGSFRTLIVRKLAKNRPSRAQRVHLVPPHELMLDVRSTLINLFSTPRA
jgi:hypothetical protein